MLASLGIGGVAAITALCLLASEIVKFLNKTPSWIPVVCGCVALVLGIAAMYMMPEFPATDYITAAAVGVVSGLAATGINQTVNQLKA